MHTEGLSNTELAKHLSIILSNLVMYKFTAHGFHWNVKGPLFSQFHDFFGELYEDAEGAIDPTAENIRKLGFDAPYMLGDFISMCSYEPRMAVGDPIEMAKILHEMNENLVVHHLAAFELATMLNQQGIADFLAGRIDVHYKWMWQLGTTAGLDSTTIHTF